MYFEHTKISAQASGVCFSVTIWFFVMSKCFSKIFAECDEAWNQGWGWVSNYKHNTPQMVQWKLSLLSKHWDQWKACQYTTELDALEAKIFSKPATHIEYTNQLLEAVSQDLKELKDSMSTLANEMRLRRTALTHDENTGVTLPIQA